MRHVMARVPAIQVEMGLDRQRAELGVREGAAELGVRRGTPEHTPALVDGVEDRQGHGDREA
jgi:hypothetical protein